MVVGAALLLTSGCAAAPTADQTNTNSAPKTLQSIAEGAGPQVALVAGASDFAPGEVRYPFLVVDKDGASVERPRARVWLARGLNQAPFEERTAHLEQVGVPGGAKAVSSHLYVAHLRAPSPGKYWVL